jgi:hypothetical protein
MPTTDTKLKSVEDLLAELPHGSLAARYVRLLRRCRKKGYPVGAMETTVQAEALSDWDAAACLPGGDLTLGDIERARARANKHGRAVVEHGHRKGDETYALCKHLC